MKDNAIPKIIGTMEVTKDQKKEGKKRIEKIIKDRSKQDHTNKTLKN